MSSGPGKTEIPAKKAHAVPFVQIAASPAQQDGPNDNLPFSRSNPEDAWHARSTISSGSSSMAYRKQMQEQERLLGAGALSSLAGRLRGLFKTGEAVAATQDVASEEKSELPPREKRELRGWEHAVARAARRATGMRPLSGILRRVDRLSFPAMLVLGTGLGLGCGALTWLLGPVGLGLSAVVLLVGALVAMSAERRVDWEDLPETPEPEAVMSPHGWVSISGGRCVMGSADDDEMAFDSEQPRHEVEVTGFWMQATPVTRRQYADVMGTNATGPGDLPMTRVSWLDAVDYCTHLSERDGHRPCYSRRGDEVTCDWDTDGYRLPTEAEWEHAARAGSDTRWFFGDDATPLERYAWSNSNAGNTVHPVAQLEPSPWGLHDIYGNVWEWCWDRFGPYGEAREADPTGATSGGVRVLRGGSFGGDPRVLRSANRDGGQPGSRAERIGFRCVRRPAPQHG